MINIKEFFGFVYIVLFTLLTLFIYGGYYIYDQNVKKDRYCGNVVDKYVSNTGYYSKTEVHIVFFSKELNRNVDVISTNNQYVNTVIGQEICFELSKLQLEL